MGKRVHKPSLDPCKESALVFNSPAELTTISIPTAVTDYLMLAETLKVLQDLTARDLTEPSIDAASSLGRLLSTAGSLHGPSGRNVGSFTLVLAITDTLSLDFQSDPHRTDCFQRQY